MSSSSTPAAKVSRYIKAKNVTKCSFVECKREHGVKVIARG